MISTAVMTKRKEEGGLCQKRSMIYNYKYNANINNINIKQPQNFLGILELHPH